MASAVKESHIDQDLILGDKGSIQDIKEDFPEGVIVLSLEFKEKAGL